MRSIIDNAFKIVDADSLHCHVWAFRASLNQLKVAIYKDNVFFCGLYFSSVTYFSGPFAWKGANFNIASGVDLWSLLLKLGFPSENKKDVLKRKRLYFVNVQNLESPDIRVEILCYRAKVSYDEDFLLHYDE
jgi:hypothetical protein